MLATAEGVLEGMIAHEPHGAGGFGYDPIFYLPAYGKTVAELPAEVKNRSAIARCAAAQARQQLLDIVRNNEMSPPSL